MSRRIDALSYDQAAAKLSLAQSCVSQWACENETFLLAAMRAYDTTEGREEAQRFSALMRDWRAATETLLRSPIPDSTFHRGSRA